MRRPQSPVKTGSGPAIAAHIFVLLIGIWAPAGAGDRPGFTSDDIYRLRSVRDAEFSPDGRLLAYVEESSAAPGRPASRLWIADTSGGQPVRLGGEDDTGSGPSWSPDGRWIAYFGRHGNRSGILMADRTGREIRFLTAVEGTNHPLPSAGKRLSWSPDGTKIAFVSATPGPETDEAGGDPVVITRYLYKPSASEGLTRFNDNKRLHIFILDVETGAIRQLTSGDHYEHSIDWSPAGDEILFVSNREPDPDRMFNNDLFTVKVEDGSIRRLTATESAEYRPCWSPDGKTIAYQGTKRGLTSSETTMEDTHIWLIDADGRNRRELGGGIDNRQGPPIWASDGSAVHFTVQERGDVRLCRLPVSGGKPEALVEDRGRVGSFSVAPGGALAYSFHDPGDLPQLYLKSGKSARRLTNLNADILELRTVAEVESMTYLSHDGLEINAFLTRPLGLTEDSKHPLIVMIKGGPHGQRGPEFNVKAQVYAARGWATLSVNYRGSTGYGQGFADAIFRDQNGSEAMDVLAGVEAALRRYLWLDRDRVGIEGGSYGGQLTNWLITQTDRFRAAIPAAGISNLISFNYMAYYHDYLAVEFGGFPHQGGLSDLLWERSPLRHAAQVKTPVMFIHGENDNDVPIAEAEQYYIALKDVGVETIMVRYPREGHGIRETKHVIDIIERSIAWYERHFAGK